MKKLLFFFIVLFWTFNSLAQNTLNIIDSGNITRERWRDSVLRMDMSQVPTGLLEEYGAPVIPMETFNGTLTDSNRIDMNLWRTLYFQLQTGWAKFSYNHII